ncbi:DNA cytosine methyltransferase [Streptomyces sp. SID3343]|uniref:DNA cytosine methyltransferase n=1 Tax=Streptomyces sp. SID3343 TaxID=2690260 RepID=UPI00136F6CE2|nr:DNA cytosine methyltransferase [Streptomyces sp. SID3343]MYV97291.1 DNA cytosine methyltransferase [Streptomyces sp. SID3343]
MILDLFAGPGGWSQALRDLGVLDMGLEWDPAACATRVAAGHGTLRVDIAAQPTAPFAGWVHGLIASPPCQAWSTAGKRLGLLDQPLVHQAVADLARGIDDRARLLTACRDKRSLLAAEPMRYLRALHIHGGHPEWVCMEEVPDVLPLWRQYAQILRSWGFSVWAGLLNAADYGVPQTRKRAILLASRVRVATPPDPTHAEHPEPPGLFGPSRPEWVSMAQALGWDWSGTVNTRGRRKGSGGNEFSVEQPSWALTGTARSWVLRSNSQAHAAVRGLHEPAPTLFFGHRANESRWAPAPERRRELAVEPHDPRMRLTVAQASLLQAFPADYPWQGGRSRQFEQIGNAVPPALAKQLLAPHVGHTREDFDLAA